MTQDVARSIATTVLISAPGQGGSTERSFAEELASRLSGRSLNVLLLPDIYHLDPKGELAARLRELTGPLVLFSGHYPRAAFWTLRALGVVGSAADDVRKAGEQRPIVCLRLADKCCPNKWVEHLEGLLGPLPEAGGHLARLAEAAAERWYPVIDYERCTNCGECLEFCLFGVYDRDEAGLIKAVAPAACKPGCPACSRVCPAGAIMFPLYGADAAIAGSSHGTIRSFDPAEISAASKYMAGRSTVEEVIKACDCNCDCSKPDEASPSGSDCSCSDTAAGR
jgi:NAD-dependent dihydropyrimidine dehydrogenase PreA subunit